MIRRPTGMYLSSENWNELSTYLFIDRKISRENSSEHSLKSRFNIICAYFSQIPFNRDNFNKFIAEKQPYHKPSYLNNFIKMAKHIDKFYKLYELQDYTYFKDKKQKLVDTLTADEIKQIAEVLIDYKRQAEEINFRQKCIFYLFGTTGLRASELLNILWDNYFEDYIVLLGTKNGDDRLIPIPDFLKELINKL